MGDNTLMTLFLIFITAGINFGLFFNNKNNIENVTKRLAKLESKAMAVRNKPITTSNKPITTSNKPITTSNEPTTNNPITTSNEPITNKPTTKPTRAEIEKKLTGNGMLKPKKGLAMGAMFR